MYEKYKEIPEELHHIKQWTHSKSNRDKESLRRPWHANNGPNGALTMEQAITRANLFDIGLKIGFYASKEDPYILGDIDDIYDLSKMWEYIPTSLAYLLKKYPTYMEVSQSGTGIRFIYKFESADVKQPFLKQKFFCLDAPSGQDVYITIGKPWSRLTGNALNISTSDVTVVPLEELDKSFGLSKTLTDTPIRSTEQMRQEAKGITFPQIKAALFNLPHDQNPRIKRAFEETFRTPYVHYQFWINIMMAMHSYSVAYPDEDANCLSAFVSWSKRDPELYKGEEDIIRHWESLEGKKNMITFHSLRGLEKRCKLKWPVPRPQSQKEVQANMPLLPANAEYANFATLVDFFNIKIYRDIRNEHTLYMTGDEDIIKEHFTTRNTEYHLDRYFGPFSAKEFVPLFTMFMQNYEFRGAGHKHVGEHVSGYLIKTLLTVDLFKEYLDTPYDKLPERYQENKKNYETSTFDELFSCIELNPRSEDPKEVALYKRYYKCWLMGLPRALYYTGPNKVNNCCLILSGPEQKGKSTHFHMVLPKFFKNLIALVAHQFGHKDVVRDVSKIASTKLILYWDEIDRHLNRATDSDLKAIIDNSEQSFIDKWEVKESTSHPQSIYGGTTNKWMLELSSSGARRTFFIPIKGIDTEKMKRLCLHAIFNEVKDEMMQSLNNPTYDSRTGWQILPWLLTEEELSYQSQLHYNIMQRSEVGLILEEIYDTTAELNVTSEGTVPGIKNFQRDVTGTFKTLTQIVKEVNGESGRHTVTRTELIEELHIMCGNFSGTTRYKKVLASPACTIERGLAIQSGQKRWCMPPMHNEAKESVKSEEEKLNEARAAFA